MAKSRKSTPKTSSSSLIFIALLVVLLSGFIVVNSSFVQSVKNLAFAPVTTPMPQMPTLTPAPTATPTATPTPSPTPLSGYCLYVPVLMYHHIQPQQMAIDKKETALSVDSATFDAQMGYLAQRGYTTITAKQLVDALSSKSGLPAKSIVLTFDDGYRNNVEYAHPILQKYGLTANLMISSGLIGGENYLSWDQVRQMGSSGKWYFTNHTWSHYSLGRGDEGKINYEVATAKQQIEQNTGQTVDIFTYPYGTLGGFSILKSLGIRGAFSTIPGHLQCDSILFQLRRTRVGNTSLSAYGL